ncbi:MAG: hypothetical protein HQK75_15565 [Candidatus Magnetomorum sp.]|nr:hypothetical protein [Candidatus Magnetomorum sp.]
MTEYIDNFAEENNIQRLAAIIGGEAVIMHGIPRTTIDLDILFYYNQETNYYDNICKRLASFFKEKFSDDFEITHFEASKDPFDPLRHDLIVVKDKNNRVRKLDILIANYKWELEGLLSMESSHSGPLIPYPKPYLIAMKLMAGGLQDEEDIKNLFFIMSNSEKEKTYALAKQIKRDKNLNRILSSKRKYIRDDHLEEL